MVGTAPEMLDARANLASQGEWPGLDQSQLYEGRDLALTTDFRQVIGEAVARHMGNKNLAAVFPGFDNQQGKFLHFLG